MVKFMTTLMPQYYTFLKDESKLREKSMREIIEEAIVLYKREKRRKMIARQYEGMENDKEYLDEMVEMAEWGMAHYLEDIDKAD